VRQCTKANESRVRATASEAASLPEGLAHTREQQYLWQSSVHSLALCQHHIAVVRIVYTRNHDPTEIILARSSSFPRVCCLLSSSLCSLGCLVYRSVN